jgi:hypothetical protein
VTDYLLIDCYIRAKPTLPQKKTIVGIELEPDGAPEHLGEKEYSEPCLDMELGGSNL